MMISSIFKEMVVMVHSGFKFPERYDDADPIQNDVNNLALGDIAPPVPDDVKSENGDPGDIKSENGDPGDIENENNASNLSTIAGLKNNLNIARRNIYKKDHKINDLNQKLKTAHYEKEKISKELKTKEKELKKVMKNMENIEKSERGILDLAKSNLDRQSASRLMMKLSKHFKGSEAEILAANKRIIDKQNQREIAEERRSYAHKISQAIKYYDAHFSRRQIQTARNAANTEIVAHRRS